MSCINASLLSALGPAPLMTKSAAAAGRRGIARAWHPSINPSIAAVKVRIRRRLGMRFESVALLLYSTREYPIRSLISVATASVFTSCSQFGARFKQKNTSHMLKNEGSSARSRRGILAQSIPASVLSRIRARVAGPRARPKALFSEHYYGAETSGGLSTLPVVVARSSSRNKTSPPTMRRSSRCSAAATVLTASLLLPPWISRAAVHLSSFRYGESADWQYRYNAASALREMTEMAAMAILQDLSVAAFACCFVLLPGMILAAGTSPTERAPSMVRKVLVVIFGLVAYVVFIAPVWLDLLSQLLTGMRIRHEYVTLMLHNFGMFSSSLGSFHSSNLYDARVVVVLLIVVWSFRRFLGAMYTLALSSPCSRVSNTSGRRHIAGPSSDNGASNTTTIRKQPFRILVRTLRRYCARPLGLLLGLASLYTLINLTVMTSLSASRTSTSSALHASNVIFLLYAEALGVPYLDPTSDGFLLPSSIGVSFNKGTKPSFVAPSERFVDWDAKYPFYRRTLGYRGPRAFHINSLPDNRRPNVVMITTKLITIATRTKIRLK